MNQLNQIILEGNLTKDCEVRTLPSGQSLVEFSIASNRFWKKGDDWEKETSFFDVKSWNQKGRPHIDQLKKGVEVRIIGRIKQERWQNKDNHSRSKIVIYSDTILLKTKVEPLKQPELSEGAVIDEAGVH